MQMENFYGKCGDLLLIIQGWHGTRPTRKFYVEFQYDYGTARYNGEDWLFHIYTEEEQQQVDFDRRACE